DVELGVQPEHLRHLMHAIAHLGERKPTCDVLRPPAVRAHGGDEAIFDRERGEDACHLKGAADAGLDDLSARASDKVCASETYAASVREDPAADEIEECAFAGAIGPDDRRERSRRE